MGLPIAAKWVWGAMNLGEEYTGLEPLDAAFAGRFAWVLPVPQASAMNSEDLCQVIVSEGPEDAMALKTFWRERPAAGNGHKKLVFELSDFLLTAAGHYATLQKKYDNDIAAWMQRLAKLFAGTMKTELDGRRLSMIRRNLLSVLAIRMARGLSDELPLDLPRMFKLILPYSLQNSISGKPLKTEKIKGLIDSLAQETKEAREYLTVTAEADSIKKMASVLASKLEPALKTKAVLEIL
ncbi:MAG: hypothetical protein AABZ44_00360 [Elusimicrobiota bacterium]